MAKAELQYEKLNAKLSTEISNHNETRKFLDESQHSIQQFRGEFREKISELTHQLNDSEDTSKRFESHMQSLEREKRNLLSQVSECQGASSIVLETKNQQLAARLQQTESSKKEDKAQIRILKAEILQLKREKEIQNAQYNSDLASMRMNLSFGEHK